MVQINLVGTSSSPRELSSAEEVLQNARLVEQRRRESRIPAQKIVYLTEKVEVVIPDLRPPMTKAADALKMSEEDLKEALDLLFEQRRNRDIGTVTIESIKREVCKAYGLTMEELVSDTRAAYIIQPRHVGMLLARKFTTKSFLVIGKSFKRDHTTIIHGIAKLDPVFIELMPLMPSTATVADWIKAFQNRLPPPSKWGSRTSCYKSVTTAPEDRASSDCPNPQHLPDCDPTERPVAGGSVLADRLHVCNPGSPGAS